MMLRPLLFLLCTSAVSSAFGLQFSSTNQFVQEAGTSLKGELWLAATATRIEGVAERDLFLAAYTNTLTGRAAQDLWAVGDAVEVSGSVGQDARVAARTVTIEGTIEGNLLAAAETIQLGAASRVAGDALLAGGQVVANGTMGGSLRVFAQRATLGGVITGPVRLMADDIVVLRDTHIQGDLIYNSPKELFLDDTVVVDGKLVRKDSVRPPPSLERTLLLQGALLLGALLVGTAFISLLPATGSRAVQLLRHAPWRCGLVGLLSVTVTPLFCLLAAASLFALPLALMLACALVLLGYLSKIVVALTLGSLALQRQGHQPFGRIFVALLVGLVFLYILTWLPIVGGAVWLLTVTFGAGALISSVLMREHGLRPIASPPSSGDRQNEHRSSES